MFWILKRTGAANFFNSLNNNCLPSKSNLTNNNVISKNNAKRPERKAYGRLSMDSDDALSLKDISKSNLFNGNGNAECDKCELYKIENSNIKDSQGNFIGNERDLDLEASKNEKHNDEFNENTISRLQAIGMSDDEDYDEALTCNVCDRSFHCHRQLASHQQKKRHFGCSGCDSLFSSLMLLEHHKEEFEHWSEDELEGRRPCCRNNRGDDYSDTDSITSEAESEDMERLL